ALADRESEEWGKALIRLTLHEPATVADMLRKRKEADNDPEKADRRERDMNQWLNQWSASFFAHKCGKDREKNLNALLDANDPWVRAAAAVYLCFENEAKGVAALKKMTKLEGDPGGWAALTLARRGHKDAVPRAIALFPKKWTDETEADNL